MIEAPKVRPNFAFKPEPDPQAEMTIEEFAKSKGIRGSHLAGFLAVAKSQGTIDRNGKHPIATLNSIYVAYGGAR